MINNFKELVKNLISEKSYHLISKLN